MIKNYAIVVGLLLCANLAHAQQKGKDNAWGGLTATSKSQYAIMTSTPLDAVTWTGGFWGERFNVLSHTSVQSMW